MECPDDPSLCAPCFWFARSPLRAAFDIFLIIALITSYIPQFLTSYKTRPSSLPATYILLTLLLLTFLNSSHIFGIVQNDYSSCISLDFSTFSSWERAGAALGIAQVGALWWCEVINAVLWIISARPGAAQTSTFINVEAEVNENDDEEAAEDQALLGTQADSSTRVFGKVISERQKWYATIAAVVAIVALSTGLYVFARHISLHETVPAEPPRWEWDDYKSRAGLPAFITLRVLTMVTFPLPFVALWYFSLREGKATGLDRKGLWMQAGVLLAIGASLTQMLWRWGGLDGRQFGMSIWMEAAGTLITLALVRGGIAWWMGRKEEGGVRL